uniref:J domain-containing protein n=1 Tax=Ciona savignyi TaxID=51511 RepID=H2ZN62_CIOSA
MEGNKEDAVKCYEIARNAFDSGDLNKALKFVNKSIRLYPSKKSNTLLNNITNERTKSKNGNKDTNGAMPDFSNLHGSSSATESKPTPTYTSAQRDLVKRINGCKDYYEILGVSKDASESDLKKAYRKMALQLHPDKNTAPGATDAFKAVGKAFSVLNDTQKRHQYDLYGPEGLTETTRRHRRNSDSDEWENDTAEFDPQELFNMFFGGQFPNGNVRVFRRGNTYYYSGNERRRQNRRENHEQQNNFGPLIQLLPLLVLFMVSIMSNMLISDPVYSLKYGGDYTFSQRTDNFQIQFFVKSDFSKQYKKGSVSLRHLEETVEADYIEHLRNMCYQERVNKENLRRKGIYFGSKDMIQKSEKYPTKSCDTLEQLFKRS